MKVVVINGQTHKGSTYHLGRMCAENLTEKENITEFFLPKDLNHFCVGCYQCMKGIEKCPFYAGKSIIAEAMEEADVIILTSPNYCMLPSAPLKAFIDLFYQYWIPHRPQKSMFSKKAVVISTTAGMGAGKVCAQLKRTLAYWGIPYIREYSAAVQASSWAEVSEKRKEKMTADMKKLAEKVRKAKPGTPSPYIKFMFNMMALTKKNADDPEAEYWKSLGWTDKIRPWKKQS